MQESIDIEFKELDRIKGTLPESLSKTIVAFANTSGKSYEESRSLNQELTFETLRQEMKIRNIEFDAPQMNTLKLAGSDGLYTNLALLLSDQCPHTIKVAIFQGEDNAIFRARKEFSGSLLKQLNDAYQFLDFYNETKADFSGLLRYDQRDYPEDAVREALLNSIIHRDYLFTGSTIINIFKNHMEFISLGGLVRGISMDAVYLGVSQSRNPNLANIFYRMGLIESYGTGVRKILRLYNNFTPAPTFRTAEGVFAVELPNRNETTYVHEPVVSESAHETVYKANSISSSASSTTSARKTAREELKDSIYKLAKENGCITRKDIEDTFGFGSTKAFKYLKILCAEGKIIQQKNGNQTTYVPT